MTKLICVAVVIVACYFIVALKIIYKIIELLCKHTQTHMHVCVGGVQCSKVCAD